jgi:adenylosuccinate synthase
VAAVVIPVSRFHPGHTSAAGIDDGCTTHSFHLLPSGLINPKCLNLIGSGVVFHVPSFFKELGELEEKGLENVYDRIFVSDRVQIDLDLHAAVDGLEEVELGERKIGTTGRGIGPSYSTKAASKLMVIPHVLRTLAEQTKEVEFG